MIGNIVMVYNNILIINYISLEKGEANEGSVPIENSDSCLSRALSCYQGEEIKILNQQTDRGRCRPFVVDSHYILTFLFFLFDYIFILIIINTKI